MKEIRKSFIKVFQRFYINYLTLFNMLEPIYKKYKEFKMKRMEKEYQSLSFFKNIDNQPLLEDQSQSRDKLDIKEYKKVIDKFREQFSFITIKMIFFIIKI